LESRFTSGRFPSYPCNLRAYASISGTPLVKLGWACSPCSDAPGLFCWRTWVGRFTSGFVPYHLFRRRIFGDKRRGFCCAFEYRLFVINEQLKPNSITLAGSELAPNNLRTSFERAPNRFGASSEPASVMEFGFKRTGGAKTSRLQVDGTVNTKQSLFLITCQGTGWKKTQKRWLTGTGNTKPAQIGWVENCWNKYSRTICLLQY